MMTKTRKPTPAQLHVLRQMAAGWSLVDVSRSPFFDWVVLLERGTESRPVRRQLLQALVAGGQVSRDTSARRKLTETYQLTDAGRAALPTED
jgi:hypothetical protein